MNKAILTLGYMSGWDYHGLQELIKDPNLHIHQMFSKFAKMKTDFQKQRERI